MEWTTTPPTQPGFYWARLREENMEIVHNPGVTIVEVCEDLGQLYVSGLAIEPNLPMETIEWWAGPLVPPT
jgi:hypothetical protein